MTALQSDDQLGHGDGRAALLKNLGADQGIQKFEIVGGIGRLVLRADGSETWEPTLPDRPRQPDPPPRQADQALVGARRAACAVCPSWVAGRCDAAGCGCAGEGRAEVWSSRCPLGRWPALSA